jgi:hypothetical protein
MTQSTYVPAPEAVAGRVDSRNADPALKALADVMSGADPDPELTAQVEHLDEVSVHLAVAAAVRASLLSRPASTRERLMRRLDRDGQLLAEAHGLAVDLAAAAAGDASALRYRLRRSDAWLEPALLIGRMQIRLMESVCSQIEMVAEHFTIPRSLTVVTARQKLADGGRINGWMQLLPDNSGNDEWLHATSTVQVNGVAKPVVVDAGPDLVSAAWAARIAAPITVTPAVGSWSAPVVSDALGMSTEPVRQWVASMSRELAGDDDRDLMLRIGQPLRRFLISPAAVAIGRMFPPRIGAVRRVGQVVVPLLGHMLGDSSALMPSGACENFTPDDALLSRLRGVPVGCAVGPDTVIDDAIPVSDITRDEMALLALIEPRDIGEVELTVNLTTAEWEDVTSIVAKIRDAGAITLRSAVLGLADQDVVIGDENRLTLKLLVRSAVPVRIRHGFGAVLPAGTRMSLLGASVTKRHATLYAAVDSCVADRVPEALAAVS